MSGLPLLGWLVATAAGTGCAAALLLLVRAARTLRRLPAATAGLPWWVASLVPLATLLEGEVDRRLESSRRAALERRLVVTGSASAAPLRPAQWLVLRLLHAAVAAASTLVAAQGVDAVPAWLALPAACAGYAAGGAWLRGLRRRRDAHVLRELPSYLDLLTLCVEAGSTLANGMRIAADSAPDGPLRDFLVRVLREIRSGRRRVDAFVHVADLYDIDSLRALASALVHAEASGMSLGDVLRAQARQRSAERFAAAERLALQAPVKLIGPLVACIFPCTFIVIALPIVARIIEAGPP